MDWISKLIVRLRAENLFVHRLTSDELRELINLVVDQHSTELLMAFEESTLIETDAMKLVR
jgi:hypothetical protein